MRKNKKHFYGRIALLLSFCMLLSLGISFTSVAESAETGVSKTADIGAADTGGTDQTSLQNGTSDASGDSSGESLTDPSEDLSTELDTEPSEDPPAELDTGLSTDPTEEPLTTPSGDFSSGNSGGDTTGQDNVLSVPNTVDNQNGIMTFTMDPDNVYDYEDILYTWREDGKSLKSLMSGSTGSGTQIGGISLSYKNIPVDYNFSLGGDMSAKELTLSRGAIDGTQYSSTNYKRGGIVDIASGTLANQGLTTSWFYDLEEDNYDTPSCLYPSVGTYTDSNGNVYDVDVKLTLVSYGKNEYRDGVSWSESTSEYSINKTMLFGFRMNQIGVACLGLDYMEVRYDFYKAGTTIPLTVKGNTTFTDIDYAQGILIADGTCDGILINPLGEYPVADSVYGNAVAGGVYIYDDYEEIPTTNDYPGGGHVYNTDGSRDGHSRSAAYTELFAGSSLTRTYTFAREYGRRARGAIDNETDPVVLKEDGLIIKKTVSGDIDVSPEKFTFSVHIQDGNGTDISSGEFGDVEIRNGYGYLEIGRNSQKEITGLQLGYKVTITEQDYTPTSITASGGTVSGNTYTYTATGEGKLIQVVVNNTITAPRELTIKKEVTGAVDIEREFQFDITIWDDKGALVSAGTYGDLTVGQNGKGQLLLKHSETKTIKGLGVGYRLQIEEETDDSYDTTVNGNKTNVYEYTFAASNREHSVTFVNTIKTTEFSFTKVKSEDYQAGLVGAEFKLYRLTCTNTSHNHNVLVDTTNPGNCWELTATETSDPEVTFTDLTSGEYRLAETKAPDGRVLPTGQWKIIISNDLKINCSGTVGETLPPAFVTENGEWLLPNMKPMDIPSSGGNGTMLFALLGVVFMGGGSLLGFAAWKHNGRTRGKRIG